MYCQNCGNEVDDKAFVCVNCGHKLSNQLSSGELGCFLLGLSFLFPILGLILYLVWQDSNPEKAASAGKAALWGFIIGVILALIGAI